MPTSRGDAMARASATRTTAQVDADLAAWVDIAQHTPDLADIAHHRIDELLYEREQVTPLRPSQVLARQG